MSFITNDKSLTEIQKEVHGLADDRGWWIDADHKIIPEKLMLIVSEISEALECYREPDEYGDRISSTGKPEGFGVELADAIIRILDLSEWLGLNMSELVATKHEYNKSRPFRHGGKTC